MKMATLTVFTPLYNRINTLKRTYESLKDKHPRILFG